LVDLLSRRFEPLGQHRRIDEPKPRHPSQHLSIAHRLALSTSPSLSSGNRLGFSIPLSWLDFSDSPVSALH